MTIPRPSRLHPLRPLARAALLCCLTGAALAARAQTLQVLYWDANGLTAGIGGTGTWDLASKLWAPTAVGIQNVGNPPVFTGTTWPGGAAGSSVVATFAGAAGIVTLHDTLQAAALDFRTDGYTLNGGGTLQLGGAAGNGTITVAAGRTTTIGARLQGNVLYAGLDIVDLRGGGTLVLNGVRNGPALMTVSEGSTLRAGRSDALSATAVWLQSTNAQLDIGAAAQFDVGALVMTAGKQQALGNTTLRMTGAMPSTGGVPVMDSAGSFSGSSQSGLQIGTEARLRYAWHDSTAASGFGVLDLVNADLTLRNSSIGLTATGSTPALTMRNASTLTLQAGATLSSPVISLAAGSRIELQTGGQLSVGSFDGGAAVGAQVIFSGGQLVIGGGLPTGNADSGYSGLLSGGSGTLRKTGPGTLSLTNSASTFAGVLSLEAGRLLVHTSALRHTVLEMAAGTLLDVLPGSGSTFLVGALSGSVDFAPSGLTRLMVGGGDVSGTWSGRLGDGRVELGKYGSGRQTLVGGGAALPSSFGVLAADGGTLELFGGNFTVLPTGGDVVEASADGTLLLSGGARLRAQGDVLTADIGQLRITEGAVLEVQRPGNQPGTVLLGGSGAGGRAEVTGAGSTLRSPDRLQIGNAQGVAAGNPGVATLSVQAGGSVSAPVLGFGTAASRLELGAGGTATFHQFSSDPGARAAATIAFSGGTLVLGDTSLASTLVTGTASSFAGTLTGDSGLLRKIGPERTEILNPASTFAGRVQVEGGVLAVGNTTLKNATLAVAGGSVQPALNADGVWTIGALDGSFDLGAGGLARLNIGGGDHDARWTGRPGVDNAIIYKTGTGAQTFLGGLGGATFRASLMQVNGGTMALSGGEFGLDLLYADQPGSLLRIDGGAQVSTGSRLRLDHSAQLDISGPGTTLTVRPDANGFAILESSNGDARIDLRDGASMSLTNVLIGSANLPAFSQTMTVRSGATLDVGVFQFEGNRAQLVVDGATATMFSPFVRDVQASAARIALSDPADGRAALTIGLYGDGDLYVTPVRYTDAGSGPGSVRKVGRGDWTLTRPLEITGRVVVDGGRVVLGSTADFATVQLVLGTPAPLKVDALPAGGVLQVAALGGTAALSFTQTLSLDIGRQFGRDSRFDGALQLGAGVLGKYGSGTQTLAGGGSADRLLVRGGALALEGGVFQVGGNVIQVAASNGAPTALRVDQGARLQAPGATLALGASTNVPDEPAASLVVTGAGTQVSLNDLVMFRPQHGVRVGPGALLTVSDLLLVAGGDLVVDRGQLVANALQESAPGRFLLSDPPSAPGADDLHPRTALTWAYIAFPGSSQIAPVPRSSLLDGPSGAGGVTWAGNGVTYGVGDPLRYTGPTVVSGAGNLLYLSAPITQVASTQLIATDGASLTFAGVSFDATGKRLRTDDTGRMQFGAIGMIGGTLEGAGHRVQGVGRATFFDTTLAPGATLHVASAFDWTRATIGGRLVLDPAISARLLGSTTLVPGGRIEVGAQARLDANPLTLRGSSLANDGLVNAPVTVDAGGRITGRGRFGDALTLLGGGAIAPGPGAGAITSASALLLGGGIYEVDIADATGTAGTGWDLWTVLGNADFRASASNPFTLRLSTAGITGFDPLRPWRFHVLEVGSLLNYTPGEVALDLAGSTIGGHFGIEASDTGLDIVFQPVPEPGTWALWLAGAGALAARRFRTAGSRPAR